MKDPTARGTGWVVCDNSILAVPTESQENCWKMGRLPRVGGMLYWAMPKVTKI
jgi:hypothetical protein